VGPGGEEGHSGGPGRQKGHGGGLMGSNTVYTNSTAHHEHQQVVQSS